MKNKLNRRDFLKKSTSTVLGAGLVLKTGFSLSTEAQEQSRVVEIKHPKAVAAGRKVNTLAGPRDLLQSFSIHARPQDQ